MKYCVLDLETTFAKQYGRVGNSLIPENKVVRAGQIVGDTDELKHNGNGIWFDENLDQDVIDKVMKTPGVFETCSTKIDSVYIYPEINPEIFKNDIIVAHNSKFELLWLFRYHWEETLDWLIKGGVLWCTQFTEYQLSGKTAKLNSLDQTAPKYGGTVKESEVSNAWDAGIQTEEIPTSILDTYLFYDIYNTLLVFLGQYKKIQDRGLYKALVSHFRYMVFTGFCEFFGMYLRPEELDKIREDCLQRKDKLTKELYSLLTDLVNKETLDNIDFAKNDHVSAIVYGGVIKWEILEPAKRKNGNDYFKHHKFSYECKGLGVELVDGNKAKKAGYGHTDSKTLGWFSEVPFIAKLIELRKVEQLLKTFLNPEGNGIRGLVHPDNHVHGHLGHTNTSTGRLNSHTPNMQNIEKDSLIKTAFPSRYEEGSIIELDWKGLENCTMAQISGDVNLIQDLWDGIDLHSKTACALNNIVYHDFIIGVDSDRPDYKENKVYKKLRSAAKAPSFAYAYGAGPKKLMESTKLPEAEVKAFVEMRKKLYPLTVQFYDDLYTIYTERAVRTNIKTEEGNYKLATTWYNAFGWPIVLYSYDSPIWVTRKRAINILGNNHPFTKKIRGLTEKDRDAYLEAIDDEVRSKLELTSFTNTIFKNYPNQNLAAELVAIFVGLLLTKLLPYIKDKKILPINTIHDSYIFDVYSEKYAILLVENVKYCEKIFPQYLKQHFNVDIKVPLKLDIKQSKTWKAVED